MGNCISIDVNVGGNLMIDQKYYLDLFSGAGGLSEGFMRAGFMPVAHIDSDPAACYTLKTRMAYKWAVQNNKEDLYEDYTKGIIKRSDFYEKIPTEIMNSVINMKISTETLTEIFGKIDSYLGDKKIDLIIGGPPCQAYSVVGRARDKGRMMNDSRNKAYVLFAFFLKKYMPEYFVFENVIGLLSAKDKDGIPFFESMQKVLKECGYSLEYRVLNSKDFGVLQNRRRIVIIGKKGEHENFYPNLEKHKHGVNVSEIFNDLPAINSDSGSMYSVETHPYGGQYLFESGIRTAGRNTATLHKSRYNNERDLEIYKIAVEEWNSHETRLNYETLPDRLKTQNNRHSFLDRYKVVAANLNCAQTVVAHLSKDGHYFIHPDQFQNRSITPREAARLQTFPDDYFFESKGEEPSITAAFRQIGNAVPVLLAEKIAKSLKNAWK